MTNILHRHILLFVPNKYKSDSNQILILKVSNLVQSSIRPYSSMVRASMPYNRSIGYRYSFFFGFRHFPSLFNLIIKKVWKKLARNYVAWYTIEICLNATRPTNTSSVREENAADCIMPRYTHDIPTGIYTVYKCSIHYLLLFGYFRLDESSLK